VSHGVATASHFVGDLQVGRLLDGRDPQDQATTEDQRLRGGMSPRQGLESLTIHGV
jgi:hypothetical protein